MCLLADSAVFVLNCWMVAATLAVSMSSPSWVMSQITYANGTAMRGVARPMAPDARVTVFDPRTLKPYQFVVSADDRELPQFDLKNEDRPGAPWWHAALTMALYRLGATVPVVGIQSNGTINPAGGSAWQTLAALTGKEATYTLSAETTPDQFFQIAQKAYYTPIVVTTPSYRDVEPLDKSHGYAVMWATDYGNSTRTITLRNPWGRTEEIELNAVRNATNYIGYLKGTPALGTSAARRAKVVSRRRTGTRRTRMQ